MLPFRSSSIIQKVSAKSREVDCPSRNQENLQTYLSSEHSLVAQGSILQRKPICDNGPHVHGAPVKQGDGSQVVPKRIHPRAAGPNFLEDQAQGIYFWASFWQTDERDFSSYFAALHGVPIMRQETPRPRKRIPQIGHRQCVGVLPGNSHLPDLWCGNQAVLPKHAGIPLFLPLSLLAPPML